MMRSWNTGWITGRREAEEPKNEMASRTAWRAPPMASPPMPWMMALSRQSRCKAGKGLGLFRRMLRRQVFSVALVCNLFLDLSLSRSLSASLNLSIFLCLARHVLFWPVCALLHRHENCRAWVPLPRFWRKLCLRRTSLINS